LKRDPAPAVGVVDKPEAAAASCGDIVSAIDVQTLSSAT
jgi:hypothetical protein